MTAKPLIFVDLDDTLFQTNRRIVPQNNFRIATLDKNQQPLSFMKPKQQLMVDWLFSSADVVPVTARSIEALNRVQLQFTQGAVCSHGGSILDHSNNLDQEWHEIQNAHVNALSHLMNDLPEQLLDHAKDLGSIRTWTVQENGLKIYTVAKQNDPDSEIFLTELVSKLPKEITDNFYIHTNGNNLAIIPNAISKKNAVEFYLEKYNPNNERVILGFGDSLSDFGFLTSCDWFGMPKNSQLHKFTEASLSTDYSKRGFYGNL